MQVPVILVGNKLDQAQSSAGGDGGENRREVTRQEAEEWARRNGVLQYVETSAKSGENVEDAFERATRDILEKVHRGVFDDDRVRVS